MPALRCTSAQSDHRTRFSPWAAAWSALSAGDKALWVAWAAAPAQEKTNSLGVAYYISGYQWFVGTNTMLATCFQTAVSVPPVSATPAPPTAPTTSLYWVEDNPHRSRMTFTAADFAFGAMAVVFCAANQTLGRMSNTSNWRFLAYWIQPSGIPEDIKGALGDSLGDRAADEKIWFRSWNLNFDGNRSRTEVVTSGVVIAQ
jgi:hypothetical protein